MNCTQASERLIEYVDGALEPAVKTVLHAHIEHCPPCQLAFEQELGLRRTLRDFTLPELGEFRIQQLLNQAQAAVPATSQYRRTYGLALAASCLLAIGVGALNWQGTPRMPLAAPAMATTQPQQVALMAGQERLVALRIASANDLSNVQFTIQLPEHIQLVGYPQQRTLQWQGQLKAGENTLELPLLGLKQAQGNLKASVVMGNKTQEIEIILNVSDYNRAHHG